MYICRKKSFTLIELLIVIAIISILAAMLLPTLSTARKKAHVINCVSNLKQFGILMNQYQMDNDDVFILPFLWNPSAHGWNTWDVILGRDYINEKYTTQLGPSAGSGDKTVSHLFECPTDNLKRTPQGAFNYKKSYRLNANPDSGSFDLDAYRSGARGISMASNTRSYTSSKAGKVKKPSQSVTIFDYPATNCVRGYIWSAAATPKIWFPDGGFEAAIRGNHSTKYDYGAVMVDGSAGNFRLSPLPSSIGTCPDHFIIKF